MGVIGILSLILYQLIKGQEILGFLRGNSMARRVTLNSISEQLKTIAGNHLHDLPGIRTDVTTLLNTQADISKELKEQGERMVRVETLLGIGVPTKK